MYLVWALIFIGVHCGLACCILYRRLQNRPLFFSVRYGWDLMPTRQLSNYCMHPRWPLRSKSCVSSLRFVTVNSVIAYLQPRYTWCFYLLSDKSRGSSGFNNLMHWLILQTILISQKFCSDRSSQTRSTWSKKKEMFLVKHLQKYCIILFFDM